MFDSSSLPEPAALPAADDAALIGAIEGWARASAAADARRLAAIAELARRRCELDNDDERALWACDPWDSAAAEVAAALNSGQGFASDQIDLSVTLRDRFPKCNAVFLTGAITARIAAMIATRTLLVRDAAVLAQLDARLAERASGWAPLSQYKLQQAIDVWVDRFDPAAVRRTRSTARSRDLTVGAPDDAGGMSSIWGRLYSTDATLLDRRLTAMAHTVCTEDPRTLAQRRADALGALAAGADHLTCGCGAPTCPAATADGRATSVIVHIVADHTALHAQPDPALHGDHTITAQPQPEPEPEPQPEPEPEPEPGEGEPNEGDPDGAPGEPEPFVAQTTRPPTGPAPAAKPAEPAEPAPAAPAEPVTSPTLAEPVISPAPAPVLRAQAGIIPGGGIVPAPLLAELIRAGATIRYVRAPKTQPEPHYRPSAALAEYIRTRDLTCRFPGCDRPAEHADLDHTLAWPTGQTHPSNLKTYCRKHHLLATFWTGDGGWADHQLPDGTLVVTTPAGKTYTTRPGSALLFPGWNTTTPAPPANPTTAPTNPGRALMMPKRKRTRTQNRAYRIQAERALNEALIAENDEPPPF